MTLLARLFPGVDGTSCQAERKSSALSATQDSLRNAMAADKVEEIMLLRLNQSIFPEIRAYESELAKMNGDVTSVRKIRQYSGASKAG